ncbi:MAG: DNA mismatch repair protein MutS, partial [Acidobacteria bacterium]|nr:DNA mismatch repair protein MutS [Acidobacteriota bacterium]
SFGALSLIATLFPGPVASRWEYLAAVLAGAVFLFLVTVHDRVLKALERSRGLAEIQREGLARLERRWGDLPLALRDRRAPPEEPAPAFAQDLDLFGRASLAQLLGSVATPAGATVLDQWLLEPASPEEVTRRQEAVEELAGEVEFRQNLELLGRLKGAESHRLEAFLDWAEGEPWWLGRPWGRPLIWALTVVTPVLGVLAGSGAFPFRWFLLLLVGNLALSYRFASRIYGVFAQVSERERPFARYARVFEHLSSASWTALRLQRLTEALEATGATASSEIERLHRIVERSDLRFSSLHFLVQAVTLWDFHVLAALETWQRRAGGRVRGWFEALGEWEAASALATLAHDHPSWTWPRVDPEAESLRGVGLGHPLLPPDRCVANDVEVGPPGTFLLVTGSNMSGKSTLLRALGLNSVLAQAGGPVCASSLVLPPLRLGTSIRVEDSLEQGTSFFLAELKRLKAVVDAADGPGPRLLYLLDEILRGTNSAERRVAVQRVVEHLVEVGALGAVSTHDLELAELPELAAAVHPVHFRETLHSGEGEAPMTFDYRLREGVATTRNALKLLELMGLDFRPD